MNGNDTYLFLNDEGEINNTYKKYYIISPNFTRTIEACKKMNVQYCVVEDCWNTIEDVKKDKKYLDSVQEHLLSLLTADLNKYHHVDYTVNEWGILLNAWLKIFISSMWEKYCRVKKFFDLQVDCVCAGNVSGQRIPLDYYEFEDCIKSDKNLNISMYFDAFRGNCKKARFLNHEDHIYADDVVQEKTKTIGRFKFYAYRLLLKLYINLFGKRTRVVAHDCYLPFKFLMSMQAKTFGKILDIEYDYLRFERFSIGNAIDTKWRTQCVDILDVSDDFCKLVARCIRRYIPRAYLEGREYLYNAQRMWFDKLDNVSNIIYSAGGVIVDELFKYYLMELRHDAKDVIFRDVQHGGNYGIDLNGFMSIEYEASDYLYTWGWLSNNIRSTTLSMPSAKLLNRRILPNGDGTILYIGYAFYQNYLFIDPDLVFFHTKLESEMKFIKKYSILLGENFIVRLHPDERNWGIRERLESWGNVQFDNIPSFYDSLSRASLAICSTWNTTVLESLYADIPTVVIKPLDEFEEEFRIDANEMRRFGLLFENFQELDEWLESMGSLDSMLLWWKDPMRQAYIRDFKRKFVYMPNNATLIWEKELRSLC